jgi:DNA-binding MarR family transcriptional regulator
MAYLYKNKQAPMTTIRDELGVTGGNLGSHALKLEAAGYLEVRRVLVGIFEVRYFITPKGVAAFDAYVRALRELIAESTPTDGGGGREPGS